MTNNKLPFTPHRTAIEISFRLLPTRDREKHRSGIVSVKIVGKTVEGAGGFHRNAATDQETVSVRYGRLSQGKHGACRQRLMEEYSDYRFGRCRTLPRMG
jgi:hypothetical protein